MVIKVGSRTSSAMPKPKTAPLRAKVTIKPKASALSGKEIRAIAAKCATTNKANPALKAYIAAGKSRRKTG